MDIDNVKTIIEAAREGDEADKKITDIDGIPLVITPNGSATILKGVLDLADERAASPRRRKGEAKFDELDSFIAHVNRFKDLDSAVFADIDDTTMTAVLDYHRAGATADPRWGQHRSIYECPLSVQWQRWTGSNGVQMSQDDFAQFIESNMDDLASPTGNGGDKDLPMPSEVLTMARNLVIHSKGTFSRSLNPTTGESSLVCKNENDPAVSTRIPRAFLLGIPVFEAGASYRMEARLRLHLSGRAMFSYLLYRSDEILRDAFGEVRAKVADKTGLPVLAGSPE
jgi:uncharacterized protein YfdQ (DUF2303 family)